MNSYASEVLQWAMNVSRGDSTAPFPTLPGAPSGAFSPSAMGYNVRGDFSPLRIAPEEQQRIEEEQETQRLIRLSGGKKLPCRMQNTKSLS